MLVKMDIVKWQLHKLSQLDIQRATAMVKTEDGKKEISRQTSSDVFSFGVAGTHHVSGNTGDFIELLIANRFPNIFQGRHHV